MCTYQAHEVFLEHICLSTSLRWEILISRIHVWGSFWTAPRIFVRFSSHELHNRKLLHYSITPYNFRPWMISNSHSHFSYRWSITRNNIIHFSKSIPLFRFFCCLWTLLYKCLYPFSRFLFSFPHWSILPKKWLYFWWRFLGHAFLNF